VDDHDSGLRSRRDVGSAAGTDGHSRGHRGAPAGSDLTAPKHALVEAIVAFLGGQDFLDRDDVRAALEREIDRDGPEALLSLMERLSADHGWGYYPPDPLARRIHHLLAQRFLTSESRLVGAHHLGHVGGAPAVIVSNHLSYADANVIEILLHRGGGTELAERLTALAGPKVFTSRERRFSSLCFGTIKVPQSADVSSEEAVLSARNVARAARQAIQAAHQRLAAGDALVLFGEGTRSRGGGMQRLLPAVARYLEVPGTWVLPVGLTGPESLFPVGDTNLCATAVTLTIGEPVRADALQARAGHDRRAMVDGIGVAIAGLLPPEYRGVYAGSGQV
jgi:1-acyl-sn-glycerol-3-phosphate acyltransferase